MALFTRLFILTFLSGLGLQTCMNPAVEGNGNLVNAQISISDYDEIVLGGNLELVYEQSTWEAPFLQITTDENILPLLEAEVRENILYLKPKNDIHPSRMKIYSNSTGLKKIHITGTGEVRMKGEVNADRFAAVVSDSGRLNVDSLYCNAITCKLNGSAKAELEGVCNNAVFEVSDFGKIIGFNYQAQQSECSVSDRGRIETHVNKTLNCRISGAGEIFYDGEPLSVNQHIAGSGKVLKKG